MSLFTHAPLRQWITGTTAETARLKFFDPADPALFVPRRFGAGIAVNTGAVAVKLGLLRPDDDLADTAPYLDRKSIDFLRFSPVVPLAVILAAGWRTRRDTANRYPIKWNWTTRPTKFAPAWIALGIPAVIATVCTASSLFPAQPEHHTGQPEPAPAATAHPRAGVDVSRYTIALGQSVMCAGIALAALKSARIPDKPNPGVLAAVAAGPVAATTATVWAVRRALNSIAATLAENHSSVG